MTTETTAQSYYDQRWEKEPKANLWAMNRAAVILTELSALQIKNPRILDLGCGTGWMTDILSQFGHAEGLDLSPAPARKFHPDLTFHDVSDKPQGLFDIVISQEVIEHAENQKEYLERAFDLIRPDGYLIITTPNAKVSLKHPEFLIQPTEKHLTSNELRFLLSSKFSVEKIYSFFYGYAGWRPYRFQVQFGKFFNAGLHLAAVCRRK
jgi:2-polyprenyl-3-methyl-5-hydroxy-6-metoxy-1,4-benzoquinol methylase